MFSGVTIYVKTPVRGTAMFLGSSDP